MIRHNWDVSLMTLQTDSFAYADRFDEGTKRYQGLRSGQIVQVDPNAGGLVVKPKFAKTQIDQDRAEAENTTGGTNPPISTTGATSGREENELREGTDKPTPAEQEFKKRFFGSCTLDPGRLSRDVTNIADEVVQHLAALLNTNVTVTMEIHADSTDGFPENVVRIVTENCGTLKFEDYGFEKE